MIPQVILKPKRAQPFFGRHPWVFAGAVERIEGEPADGDEIELRSTTGTFIARGLYNSQSKILVRLYCWEPDVSLDESFFRERIRTAIRLRHDVLHLNHGPAAAYRVIFSESDYLSGMIVDRYADFLTLQCTALGLGNRREMIAKILAEELGVRGIYLRTEKGIGKLEGLKIQDEPLWGEPPPTEIVIVENGLSFAVNLAEGQKTGYYLDQRDNRVVVAKLAAGRKVLDAFSYSGGFGLYAAKGGATSVECVDASKPALELAERNAVMNGLGQLTFTHEDVFKHMTSLVEKDAKYDLIVLDPPKFARNRAALPDAIKGYRRLHQMALKLLSKDGLLVTCCCTGLIKMDDLEEVILQTAQQVGRDLQILERRGPSADHPTAITCREGAYLKCIVARLL